MNLKTNDIVRFLNTTGGGRVVRIDGNIAYVEDADGFEIPMPVRECVVVGKADDKPKHTETNQAARMVRETPPPSQAPLMSPQPLREPEPESLPVVETTHGDLLNLVVAFEPENIKQLSSTAFEAIIVNDSNYYVSFTLSTRAADETEWTLRRASVIEPNIELSLGQFTASDLNDMERILVQYIAYKDIRPFQAKNPASVEIDVDTTKFFRLHCFKDNMYFDTPVIAFDIVRDDKPYRRMKIDAASLEQAVREKKTAEKPVRRPVKRRKTDADGPLVIDLHINELVNTTAGMSRADMLNLQIDTFRRVMDENRSHHGRKIVFIHGKGEGILRQALLKELSHSYKGHDVCDASFREYGFGATQVTIR